MTGLKTHGSSDSSAVASRGHKKALAIHDPSPSGRAAMICTNPEHNLDVGEVVGIAIAA